MKIAETIDKAWVDAEILEEQLFRLTLLMRDSVATYVFNVDETEKLANNLLALVRLCRGGHRI